MNYVEILSVPAPLLPWSGTEGGVAGARDPDEDAWHAPTQCVWEAGSSLPP